MEGHLPLLPMPEAQYFCVAHKMEYLWETCTVNFIGARFVVPHCIKSNPGGSSCQCVLSPAHTQLGTCTCILFISTVALSVCPCVCVFNMN